MKTQETSSRMKHKARSLLIAICWKSRERRLSKMQNLTKALYGLPIALLLLLLPMTASAQGSDPIVGTWNMAFSKLGTPTNFIAIMTFNSGGTTTEFDTNGTNASTSPGESIALGVWNNTGGQAYSFREENVTYDSSGKLSGLAVGMCNLTLAENMNSFTGTISLNFYTCSLAQCPGPLIAGPILFQVSGSLS